MVRKSVIALPPLTQGKARLKTDESAGSDIAATALIQTSRIPAYRGAKNAATTPTGSRDLPRTVKGLRTFTNTAKFVTAL